jgi:DNA-binding MltR family transcriptional regulator
LKPPLATILRNFFIVEEGSTGAAVDFIFDYDTGMLTELTKKGRIAYCCGLIPKHVWNTIQAIAGIRNRFAHTHPEVTFKDGTVVRLCKTLKFGPRLENSPWDTENQDPKRRFCVVAAILATSLVLEAMHVTRCSYSARYPNPYEHAL